MKKIVKLLPVALALMIAVPAFAEDAAAKDTATSVLNLTVPKFINITNPGSGKETTSATFDANYTTITTADNLTASFHVINNDPTRNIYLSATAPTSGGSAPALFAADAAGAGLSIVLTNSTRVLVLQRLQILMQSVSLLHQQSQLLLILVQKHQLRLMHQIK